MRRRLSTHTFTLENLILVFWLFLAIGQKLSLSPDKVNIYGKTNFVEFETQLKQLFWENLYFSNERKEKAGEDKEQANNSKKVGQNSKVLMWKQTTGLKYNSQHPNL